MAKLGEGDPRWIVDVREDGTNVNQWHWTEKDCSEWANRRLGELFASLPLVSGPPGCSVTTTGLQSVTGDALLNVRKAKLIASYELAIRVTWTGTTADGTAGSGVIELPYVADENHDEDPELKVLLPVEDKASTELKAAILASGKQAVYKAIATFVKELRDGVPSKAGSNKPAPAAAAAAANGGGSSSSGQAAAPAASNGSTAAANAGGGAPSGSRAAAASSKTCSKTSSSRSSIALSERFYASRQDIWECFTDVRRIQAYTQSQAVIQPQPPQPGATFSWFGGTITGAFEELVRGEKLVMTWRFSSWQDDCTSKVVISLEEPEPGNTVLQLKQTGLPLTDRFEHGDIKEQVEAGWQAQIFGRIKAVFGYGV